MSRWISVKNRKSQISLAPFTKRSLTASSSSTWFSRFHFSIQFPPPHTNKQVHSHFFFHNDFPSWTRSTDCIHSFVVHSSFPFGCVGGKCASESRWWPTFVAANPVRWPNFHQDLEIYELKVALWMTSMRARFVSISVVMTKPSRIPKEGKHSFHHDMTWFSEHKWIFNGILWRRGRLSSGVQFASSAIRKKENFPNIKATNRLFSVRFAISLFQSQEEVVGATSSKFHRAQKHAIFLKRSQYGSASSEMLKTSANFPNPSRLQLTAPSLASILPTVLDRGRRTWNFFFPITRMSKNLQEMTATIRLTFHSTPLHQIGSWTSCNRLERIPSPRCVFSKRQNSRVSSTILNPNDIFRGCRLVMMHKKNNILELKHLDVWREDRYSIQKLHWRLNPFHVHPPSDSHREIKPTKGLFEALEKDSRKAETNRLFLFLFRSITLLPSKHKSRRTMIYSPSSTLSLLLGSRQRRVQKI